MKKLLSIALLAVAVALGFVFVGCSSVPKDYSASFQGNWKMTNVVGMSEDDIAFMEAFGMSVLLDLNEDKTAALNMMGEEMAGSWEAESETECTLTIDGDSLTGKLNGEELSFAIEGEEMTIAKITAEEAARLKENAEAMGSAFSDGGEGAEETYDESFAPITVADDDICTISLVAKKTDNWGDTGYVANIANNTDVPIYVTMPFGKSSVDDKMVDFWGGTTVQPGKLAEGVFFYASSDDVANIDGMKNVELVIEVWNDESYDTLAAYNVSLS